MGSSGKQAFLPEQGTRTELPRDTTLLVEHRDDPIRLFGAELSF